MGQPPLVPLAPFDDPRLRIKIPFMKTQTTISARNFDNESSPLYRRKNDQVDNSPSSTFQPSKRKRQAQLFLEDNYSEQSQNFAAYYSYLRQQLIRAGQENYQRKAININMGLIICRKNQSNKIIGTGFLISKNLVLTTANNVYNLQEDREYQHLCFFVSTEQTEYEIKDANYPQQYTDRMNPDLSKFDYCLIRLKQSVNHFTSLALGINMRKRYAAIEAIIYKEAEDSNHFEQIRLGKVQYVKRESTIYHNYPLRPIDNGCPLIDKAEIFIVLGFQTEAENMNQNKFARSIDKILLQDLYSWMSRDERKELLIFQYDIMRSTTIQSYVQSLPKNNQHNQIKQKMQSFEQVESNNKILQQNDQLDKEAIKIQKFKECSQNFKSPDHEQRMGGYIDFSISNKFIEFITVDGIRLYYELYNPQKTYLIAHLSDQYFNRTDKRLHLSWQQLKLAPQTPLKRIICDNVRRQMFQKLMNYKQTDRIAKAIPSWYIQELQESQSNVLEFRKTKMSILIFKEQLFIQKISKQIQIMTTIKQVLSNLSSTSFYKFANFDILSQSRRMAPSEYEVPISQLHISSIKIVLYEASCYISARSNVFIEGIIVRGVSIAFLQQFEGKRILSFNQADNSLEYQKINQKKVFQKVTDFCIIRYKSLDKVYELKCKQFTQVRVQKMGWRKVRDLQLGQRLLGVSQDLRGQCLFTLFQRQYHYDSQADAFCGFQIEDTHTFIANRLIVHNQDHIEINVRQDCQKESRQYIITVSNNDKIGSKFKDADVYLAGVSLNRNLNFGDYHISKCRQLTLTHKNEGIVKDRKESGSIISEWGKDTMRADSYSKEQKQKWQKNHLCFYQNKIQSIGPGQMFDNFPHCILVQKLFFERLSFYENVRKYERNRSLVLQKYSTLMEDIRFEQICRVCPAITQEDAHLIYLYTTSRIYRPLNETLRKQNILADVKQQSQLYLCYAQLLIQSLSRLPALPDYTTVYRGLKISQEVLDQIENRLILFKGFTSTTKSKQVGMRFIKNGLRTDKPVLFVIKTFTGKQISKFSMLKHEEEVLIGPYTYFFIDKQTYQNDVKMIYLTQVCLPYKNVNNIVFWVDDNPSNNAPIIRKVKDEIEVVQTVSTNQMKLIIENFLWIYTITGKKVTIITDMVRRQAGYNNIKAGINLMKIFYNDYGRSNLGIVYTSKGDPAIRLIQQQDPQDRLKDKYRLFTIQSQLMDEIENSFKK